VEHRVPYDVIEALFYTPNSFHSVGMFSTAGTQQTPMSKGTVNRLTRLMRHFMLNFTHQNSIKTTTNTKRKYTIDTLLGEKHMVVDSIRLHPLARALAPVLRVVVHDQSMAMGMSSANKW